VFVEHVQPIFLPSPVSIELHDFENFAPFIKNILMANPANAIAISIMAGKSNSIIFFLFFKQLN